MTELVIEKYGNDKLIIIDIDDNDEEDDMLVRFMPSHLSSEMGSFSDNLTGLL